MKAETLKKSILQYAMQGKLVAQDPNDEPASKLLKRIKAEKDQLIKDGKILKKKPLDPFTKSDEPFDIPESWIWVYLSDVSIIQEGAGIRSYQYRDSGTQLLTVTNILEDAIDLNKSTKFVDTEEYLVKYKHLTPQKGDIVTACSGGSWGKSAIFDKDNITMLNTSTLRLRFFSDLANNKYLYYITKSRAFKNQLESQLSGMQPNFGYQHYSKILIPLPPLAEQQRIVEKLEEILPLVEEYGKNEEILSEMNKKLPKQIRQSILQYAVQGKLVPQNSNDEPASELLKRIKAEKEQLIKDGKIKKEKPLLPITADEIPYELPIGWSVARLNEIVNFENGDRSSNYPTEDEYVASGIPFWGAKDIINNKLQANPGLRFINKSKFDELRSGKLKDKDFICLLRGSVGKWAEFTIDNEWTTGFINAQMVIIRLLDLVLSNWFKIYLNSPLFIEQVSKVTTGSAVAQMSAKDLSNFIILIPPLAEQQRIVTKVEELMQIVDKLEINTR